MRAAEALFAAALVAVALVGCESDSPGRPRLPTPPGAATGSAGHVALGPVISGGRYVFDLVDGARTVRVVAARLDGRLYRITTPSGSSARPNASLSGNRVELALHGGGHADVTVTLAAAVAWTLRFHAGISTLSADLRNAELRRLDTLQGVSSLDLTAGKPSGDVALTEAAGVGAFTLRVPTGTAVTVNAHAGVGSVSLFGVTHSGVAGGTTFATGSGADRYTIETRGGVGAISVDALR